MAIKEIFESVTDKIDIATELLSEFSDREGQYVWKKVEQVEQYKFDVTISGAGSLKISNAVGFDPNSVDLSFFEGFTGAEFDAYGHHYVMTFIGNGKVTTLDITAQTSTQNDLTYDASTGTISLIGESQISNWSYTQPTFTKKSVTLHLTYTGTKTIKVSSSDIDVTKINSAYFAGMESWYVSEEYPIRFLSDTQIAIGQAGAVSTYTYSPSSATINLSSAISSENIVYGDMSKKVEGSFSYVVADNENSYTDDDVYKKLNSYAGANPLTIGEAGATIPANTLLETALRILNGVEPGADFSKIGFSKATCGTVSLSSESKTITINHGLNASPKVCVVIPATTTNSNNRRTMAYYDNIQLKKGFIAGYRDGSTSTSETAYLATMTVNTSSITFNGGNSIKFNTGGHYWIALA